MILLISPNNIILFKFSFWTVSINRQYYFLLLFLLNISRFAFFKNSLPCLYFPISHILIHSYSLAFSPLALKWTSSSWVGCSSSTSMSVCFTAHLSCNLVLPVISWEIVSSIKSHETRTFYFSVIIFFGYIISERYNLYTTKCFELKG